MVYLYQVAGATSAHISVLAVIHIHMSILVVEVTSEGMIFGGDKNVTSTYPDGTTKQEKQTEKVLKWPNNQALIGFVGNGSISGKSTTDWMKEFIQANLNFTSLSDTAEKLRREVETQRLKDEGANRQARGMIIHLGGFTKRDNIDVPEIYLITNVHGIGKYGYEPADQKYNVSEEFWKYFPQDKPKDIKKTLKVLSKNLEPFWFHQGFDLFTFNIMQKSVKDAFKLLCTKHPNHDIPKNLTEWEKHVKSIPLGKYTP